MKKTILMIILTFFTSQQQMSLVISEKSINIFNLLLPEITRAFKDLCLTDIEPIEKTILGIHIKISLKSVCVESIAINVTTIKPLNIVDENTITVQVPDVSLNATIKEDVEIRGTTYSGITKIKTSKFNIIYTARFARDGNSNIRLDIRHLDIGYDKLELEFDNKWIENAYHYFLDYKFIKNVIIDAFITPDIKKQIYKYPLDIGFDFELNEKKFFVALFDLPKFIEKENGKNLYIDILFNTKEKIDLNFLNSNKIIDSEKKVIDLEKVEKSVAKLMEDDPTFLVKIKSEVFDIISRAFKDSLKFNLNSFSAIKPFLTVKNLSVIFPGLKTIYPKEEQEINLDIEIKAVDEKFLIQRKFNLFLFSDIQITLKDPETKNLICDLSLKNYINFRISSSNQHHNVIYFNQPDLRIKNFSAENCLFEFNKQNYIKLFEDMFEMNLLSLNKLDYSVIQDVIEGPFLYLENDLLISGFKFKVDI